MNYIFEYDCLMKNGADLESMRISLNNENISLYFAVGSFFRKFIEVENELDFRELKRNCALLFKYADWLIPLLKLPSEKIKEAFGNSVQSILMEDYLETLKVVLKATCLKELKDTSYFENLCQIEIGFGNEFVRSLSLLRDYYFQENVQYIVDYGGFKKKTTPEEQLMSVIKEIQAEKANERVFSFALTAGLISDKDASYVGRMEHQDDELAEEIIENVIDSYLGGLKSFIYMWKMIQIYVLNPKNDPDDCSRVVMDYFLYLDSQEQPLTLVTADTFLLSVKLGLSPEFAGRIISWEQFQAVAGNAQPRDRET